MRTEKTEEEKRGKKLNDNLIKDNFQLAWKKPAAESVEQLNIDN